MQRHGTFGEGLSQQYHDTAAPAAQTGGMQLGAGCWCNLAGDANATARGMQIQLRARCRCNAVRTDAIAHGVRWHRMQIDAAAPPGDADGARLRCALCMWSLCMCMRMRSLCMWSLCA